MLPWLDTSSKGGIYCYCEDYYQPGQRYAGIALSAAVGALRDLEDFLYLTLQSENL